MMRRFGKLVEAATCEGCRDIGIGVYSAATQSDMNVITCDGEGDDGLTEKSYR